MISKEELNRLYWVDELSLPQIAEHFDTNVNLIWRRMKRFKIPRRSRGEGRRIKIKIFPSPSLSYVLGALVGDGYSCRKLHCVAISVKDYDFIEAFNIELCKVLKKKLFKIIPTRGRYQIATKLRAFTDWYINLNTDDLLKIALKYPADFVRGFGDAEAGSRIRSRGNSRLIEITFSNTNRDLLVAVQIGLGVLGIKPSKIWETTYRGKPYFAFSIGSKENVKKYFEKVSFNIKRKVFTIEE